MWTMKSVALFLLGGAALLLASCASVPMASATDDAAAKRFETSPDQANVYVYRGSGVGTALTVQMIVDGRITGSLAPNTYQMTRVSPGSHVISTGGAFENVERSTVNAAGGRNYFFKVGPTMGLVLARVKLEPVDETTGRAAVLRLKRAEASSY